MVKTDFDPEPCESEPGAVQAWIDGVTVYCAEPTCRQALERLDGRWLHCTTTAHPARPWLGGRP